MIDQRCRLDLASAQTQLTQWLRLQLVAAQAADRLSDRRVSASMHINALQWLDIRVCAIISQG
jgi:hypothetical protein